MLTKEQLDEIKQLHEMSEEYPEHKNVIDVELLRKGVPALIAEVERLREALLLIQNSDTWLIEPSPMMHTIEEVYHACVGIADKTLGGAQK